MKIEKRNYSRSPWRLIDNNNREVYWERPYKHADIGQTFVTEPLCGDTKTEVIGKTLELLSLCFARLNAGHCVNPAMGVPSKESRHE